MKVKIKEKVAKGIVSNLNLQQSVNPSRLCEGYYPGTRIFLNSSNTRGKIRTQNPIKL